jgi:rhodanese-related sulfurtransferase
MKKINGKELKRKINAKTKLLDIDSIDDYRQSHISHSLNIPYNEADFVSQVRKVIPNREEEIILCGKPYNSRELYLAAEKLEEEGYDNIYSHALGRQDWKRAGIDIIELR